MSAGLTRQALRGHPWSLFGPGVTLTLAAGIVSGALSASASFDNPDLDAATRRALAATDIAEFATICVMIAIYLSIVIVGLTMASTIGQQARDIALVRAIGATPGQVRRSAAAQAAAVALPSVALGVPLGLVGGSAWIRGLVDHDVIPSTVSFHASAAALPAALGISVGTAVIGALMAAIRPGRVAPAVALTDAATRRRTYTRLRTIVGVVLVLGATSLSILIARLSASKADSLGFFVALAMCVGAGLLGPALLRISSYVVRSLGGSGALAADNVAVRAKALSGALVPLVLAVGFAAIKVVMHSTAAHATGAPDSPDEVWLDYTGTAVYAGFAAVAALNTLVTVTLARRADIAATQLAGASRARVAGVLTCEALIVIGTVLLAAAVVALVTVLPLLHTAFDTWVPYVPPRVLLVGVLGTAALVGLGTVLPASVMMRRPPVEAAGVAT